MMGIVQACFSTCPQKYLSRVVNVLFCYNIIYKDVSYVHHFCEIESNHYSGLL